MNKFKLMLALLGAPCMVLASCGEQPAPVVEKKVNSVTVSCSAKEVMVSKSVKASFKVAGENLDAEDKKVTWSSSNESVATVDSSGKITGKAIGKATITATSTYDSSKFDSVEITVVALDWDSADKALMQNYLGEVLPYVDGGYKWTDEYIEDYGCLTAEVSGDKAKATYDALKAMDGFVDEGSEYDEEYDVTEYYLSKDSAALSDYYLSFNVYYYDGTTSLDVYLQLIEYEEWPAEIIASKMTEIGLEGVVPAYDAGANAGYTASSEELEDGTPCVYITVTDYDAESELGAADYVGSLDSEKYYIGKDDYGEFIISPVDKSFTMIAYDLQSDYYYGFELIVSEYIPDETVAINESYDLIAIGGDLQLTLTKGIDVSDSAVITFESDDTDVATVTNEGKITGVAKGEVVISCKVDGEVASQALFYVVESVKSEYSEADKTEFNKIHEGLMIPFSKYFDTIEYDEKEDAVFLDSSFYSYEFENFYDALIEDGWTDVLTEQYGEFAAFAYMFGMPYMFEKEVELGGNHYFVDLQLVSYSYDEESEEYYPDYEGYLSAVLFDPYIYSYADAVNEFKAILDEFGVSTTAVLPDALPASHFSVSYYEEDNDIDFLAYGATGVTVQNVVDALNATETWTAEKKHVDESVDEYGNVIPAYDMVFAVSKDGVLKIEGYVEDDDIALYVYLPEPPLADDVKFGELELANETVLSECEFVTKSGYSIVFDIGGNTSGAEPKYYTSGTQARCYAKNTITISAPEGESLPDFVIKGVSNKDGSLSANVGTLSAIDGGYSWTGDANEVVLSVSASGQYRITEIDLSNK